MIKVWALPGKPVVYSQRKSKARNGCTALLTEASDMRRWFVYSGYSRPFCKYIDKSLILSHRTL